MFTVVKRLLTPRAPQGSSTRIAVAAAPDALWGVRWHVGDPTAPRVEAAASLPAVNVFTNPESWVQLAERLNGKKVPLHVVLPPTLAKLVQINAPDLPPEERRSALTFLAAQAEERASDELVVDYVDVPALRRPSAEPLAYCALTQRALILSLIEASQKAGFLLKTIEIPEQALRRLLPLLSPGNDSPALLLLVEEESSLMVVASPTQLYLFRLSRIGRRLFASDPASGALALGLDLQRTLDFYDTQFVDPAPQQIWVIDAIAPNPEMVAALAPELRLPLTPVTAEMLTPSPPEALPLGILALTLGAALAPVDA